MTDLQKRMKSISGPGLITVTEDALEINAEGQWFPRRMERWGAVPGSPTPENE